MRILVIEDDQKVANFVQAGLEQEGYAVDVLHDGGSAGEQARAVDYDAVVLDLMLPGRSGFQVLRDIRARKPSLPGPDSDGEGWRRRPGRRARQRRRRLHGEALRAGRALRAPPRAAPPRYSSRKRASRGGPRARHACTQPYGAPDAESTSSRKSIRCSNT